MASSNRESRIMKIIVQNLKPRNHLVAMTLKRKAGFHQSNRRVARKDARKLSD